MSNFYPTNEELVERNGQRMSPLMAFQMPSSYCVDIPSTKKNSPDVQSDLERDISLFDATSGFIKGIVSGMNAYFGNDNFSQSFRMYNTNIRKDKEQLESQLNTIQRAKVSSGHFIPNYNE